MSGTGGPRVLVAGIGNVFLGDDAFGVEVVSRIEPAKLPSCVDIAEYGIRGVHLAYDLLDGGYDTVILVDAIPLGEAPGTLAVLEVTEDCRPNGHKRYDVPAVDAHSMNPTAVLEAVHTIGAPIGRMFVVGCQPEAFDQGMQLSPSVRAAVDQAVDMVRDLATGEAGRLPGPRPPANSLSMR